MERPPAVDRRPDLKAPVVELVGAGKSFPVPGTEPRYAIRNIDITVGEGEFVCIVGPSGCGKTTILNLIAGFEQPSEGSVMVDGKAITGPSEQRAVVFQTENALFGWLTALENVEFGMRMRGVRRSARRARALEFLSLVGLGTDAAKFPDQLSGGMKQRVQIARVLANDPRIILMDEPFAAVDAYARATLQGELQRIWAETAKTVIFVTHDVTEALLLGDRVIVMSNGPNATVKTALDVDLERPRDISIPGFGEYFQSLRSHLEPERWRVSEGASVQA